jgi:REP element-mobilizing transposase RayT
MNEKIEFGVFDKDAELFQSARDLPHWFQPGTATFITFRTADSMPNSTLELWRREQLDWFRRQGIRVQGKTVEQLVSGIADSKKAAFIKKKNQLWHKYLDQGCGECLLRNREFAEMVANALRFFDGDRYDLDCLIVMPNHVHLIVQFRSGVTLRKQTDSWLRYSATQINRQCGRRGHFWQAEPFDHLIRSPRQFEYLRKYIFDNPSKAGLRTSECLYWSR